MLDSAGEEDDERPINKRAKVAKPKKSRKGKGKAKAVASYSDIEMDLEHPPQSDDSDIDSTGEPDRHKDIEDSPPPVQEKRKKGKKGTKGKGKGRPTSRTEDGDIVNDEVPRRNDGDITMADDDGTIEALPRPKPRPKPVPAKKSNIGKCITTSHMYIHKPNSRSY